jgi:hypothetical protein
MGNAQLLDSRTILDQMFWAGIESPSPGGVQPPAKDAPHEPATVMSPQASPRPAEPERAPDTSNCNQPGETAVQEAAQAEFTAAADRHEPKADPGEPEPPQEIPSVSSPALQPIEHADAAQQQFRSEPQEARADAGLDDQRRGEVAELMDTLRGSLDKSEQHGERADALLNNMLLHAHEGSDEHRAVDTTEPGEDMRADDSKYFEMAPDQADRFREFERGS